MLKPEILVFAGPNGSGKSTITKNVDVVGTYVNADDMKKELDCSDLEAAEKAGSPITFKDADGNQITVSKEGEMTSEIETINVKTIDAETGETISDSQPQNTNTVTTWVKEAGTIQVVKEEPTTKASSSADSNANTNTLANNNSSTANTESNNSSSHGSANSNSSSNTNAGSSSSAKGSSNTGSNNVSNSNNNSNPGVLV